MIRKLLNYTKVGWEGNDGKFSIRRFLGTLCIISGISLTGRASYFCLEDLANQAILISPLFATGLLFFGITGYFDMKNNKSADSTQNQQ